MGVFSITTEGAEALAAATAETLLQIRGLTTMRATLVGWGVSFDGVTAGNTPVLVRLLFQTTDGTATGATEVQGDPADQPPLLSGFHSFTVEPTAGGVLEAHYVHPQGGNLIREYPMGREHKLDKATSSRIGIEVTAAQVVNAVAFLQWAE